MNLKIWKNLQNLFNCSINQSVKNLMPSNTLQLFFKAGRPLEFYKSFKQTVKEVMWHSIIWAHIFVEIRLRNKSVGLLTLHKQIFWQIQSSFIDHQTWKFVIYGSLEIYRAWNQNSKENISNHFLMGLRNKSVDLFTLQSINI